MERTFWAMVALFCLAMMAGCSTDPGQGSKDSGLATVDGSSHPDGNVSEVAETDAGGSDTSSQTDTTSNDADAISKEVDSGATDAAGGCPAGTQTYACADQPCCVTDLEKLWIDRLLGKNCENVDTECVDSCETSLGQVWSPAYVPPKGEWASVMKDGVKIGKFKDKLVWKWTEGWVVAMNISDTKVEMWGAPNKGYIQQYVVELSSGTLKAVKTLWHTDTAGNPTDVSSQITYQVIP